MRTVYIVLTFRFRHYILYLQCFLNSSLSSSVGGFVAVIQIFQRSTPNAGVLRFFVVKTL